MVALLLLLLSTLGPLHASHYSQKIFLQTTVPEKISSPDAKRDPENNVAYVITISGKPYFVHLKKQSFLSSTSVVYFYGQDNTQHSEPLSPQMNCNYNGYVAGFPNSLVTLNICSGLRGTIQFKNISYGIEPVEIVSGFVHMIYEEKSDDINIPDLGKNETYAWLSDSQYHLRSSPNCSDNLDENIKNLFHESSKMDYVSALHKRNEFVKLFPRTLEMHIVVDKNLFDYMGSDTKAVTQKIIQIIGLVNAMFSQLKLTVIISSIEIWSNKNKISTLGLIEHMLLRFLRWKHDHLNHRPHHMSYLFTFQKYPASIGATFPGKICDKHYDAAIAVYSEGLSLESYTIIIVQLLGLSLGLVYDNDDVCYCSGDVCTMMPNAVHSWGVKEFSTCSLENFKYFTSQYGLKCLQSISVERQQNSPAVKKVCGNGLLESGEQCDCGTSKNCTHPNCCDPKQCRLKGKAACGSGECCTNACKLKPANTLCRKSVDDECDFVEFCNGKDPHCVPDTHARDGHHCDSGQSYCYQGTCRIFDKQCKRLFGREAIGGSFHCYQEINTRKDIFGNCGSEYCPLPNLLCGKLVCKWPRKHLVIKANLSVVYAHVRDDTCTSAFRQATPRAWNPEGRDLTYVEDGSSCGPDMICEKFVCRELKYMVNYSSCNDTRDCNNNGICNNFQHCHCKKGFSPPNCQPNKGEFGSTDDGHAIKSGKSFFPGRRATLPKHQFQLIFYIAVPVLMIIIAVLVKQSKLKELCSRGKTENDSSKSEENISNSKSESNNPP